MKPMLPGMLALFLAGASPAAQAPEFDVATIKVPAPVGLGTPVSINLGTFRNGTLAMTNVTLAECIQLAYGLASQEQITGPDWIKSRDTRFDVVAKTAADADLDQARRMLQTLLADRLKLVVQREQRPFSFLALVAAKGGPKIVEAGDDVGAAAQNTAFRGRIAGERMPLRVLAELLSRFERQLVVDKTGLRGRYRLKLEWAADDRVAPGDVATGPSLFTALEEQLGLRLESRKEPLDVIAVERAEKVPTSN
jgi:uncharacterized protein (TIGR03435 family)